MPSLAGSRLDKYQIVEEVGHGGMAVVYRGTDTVLKREVAIKILHAHLADREESRLRLEREAIAVAKLRHDNILEIYDYSGAKAAESYIVTEFIHGPTLRAWIDEQLDPRPAVAAMIIHRLALALEHAHQAGVVHRDIKPENVMIRSEDGCIKLMDFGIAQLLDNQKLTMTGQLIGSPAYMAPELINGRPLDARTDLFSLGIILYQLATGELPFAGRNPHEVLNRIADGDYPPPSSICALVDRELETIIARALALLPEDRFQTAEEMAVELEGYLANCGVEPNGDELRGYFEDPTAYVTELDLRVCEALLERAETATRSGQNARAIRLLARVLEIDAGHAQAKAMLHRLRTRERRLRQGLLGVGVIGAGGMAIAGLLLLPTPRRPALRVELSAEPVSQYVDRIDATRSEALATSVRDEPTPPARRDQPSAPPSAATGEPLGDNTKTSGVAEGDGTDDGGTEQDETKRATGKSPRRRRVVAPRRTPPSSYDCTLKIEGIPASPGRNLKLKIGSSPREIWVRDPNRIEVHIDEPGKILAEIRSDRYKGFASLTFKTCQQGPVVIRGQNRDARVTFVGAPAQLAVKCIKGCASGLSEWPGPTMPRRTGFPIPAGQTKREVTFLLKATCRKSATVTHALAPGPNRIAVQLTPIPDCEVD